MEVGVMDGGGFVGAETVMIGVDSEVGVDADPQAATKIVVSISTSI